MKLSQAYKAALLGAAITAIPDGASSAAVTQPASPQICDVLKKEVFAGHLMPLRNATALGLKTVIRMYFYDQAAEATGLRAVMFSDPREHVNVERPAGARFDIPYPSQKGEISVSDEFGASGCSSDGVRRLTCETPTGSLMLSINPATTYVLGDVKSGAATCKLRWKIDNQ